MLSIASRLIRLQYAHIGGELSSLKDNAKTQEKDMKEFKDVNRRYKDQLVKVKVLFEIFIVRNSTTDMLFAADVRHGQQRSREIFQSFGQVCDHNSRWFQRKIMFDSAIMKYHSLKMEEVNDTMKHLWNKTYQGTGTIMMIIYLVSYYILA
jgi:DNA repair protein RAD50